MGGRPGRGVSTIRQYLQARLIDEMHVAISRILRGSGAIAGVVCPLIAIGVGVALGREAREFREGFWPVSLLVQLGTFLVCTALFLPFARRRGPRSH